MRPPLSPSTAAGAALILLLLTACPERSVLRPVPPTGETPRHGGTLRVLLDDDVDSLDPDRAARASSWFFARATSRGLLAFPALARRDGGSDPVPDLAEALPTVSADGLHYTFRLRRGIRFGPPVTREVRATDVISSVRRIIATGAGIARFLRDIVDMSAPDEHTVVMLLARPLNDLPWVLAHPQAAVVPAGLPAPGRVDPRAIAPLGPYRLLSYRPERSIALDRNPSWDPDTDPVRGGYVDRIDATIGIPAATAVARVASGRGQLVLDIGPPDLFVRPLRYPAGIQVGDAGSSCIRYLFLNEDVKPFDRGLVRLAVASAVQRRLFADTEGTGTPATRILPPSVTGYSESPVVREDVSRARALLTRAGLSRGFEPTLVVADAVRDLKEAAIIRTSLARAGVRVRVRKVPAATVYPQWYERPDARVPMGLATWCADWPGLAGRDVLGVIADPKSIATPGQNYAHLRSPAVQRALDGAVNGPPARAAGRWSTADAAVCATAAIVPLLWTHEDALMSPNVHGWRAAPMWPRGDPTALWLV
jgi:peptide/nickel transport system substrate-binding protein